MTTDPTTLRTALEALSKLTAYPFAFDNWGCRDCQQETGHSPRCRVGKAIATYQTLLATPAPAADKARCAFDACARPNGPEGAYPHLTHPAGLTHDPIPTCHPFQPAPTPAPPTPPATETVAALVEKLMWTLNALVDETWEQDDVEEVARYLDAIVAAARRAGEERA